MNLIPTGTIHRHSPAGRLLVVLGILATLVTPSVALSGNQAEVFIGEAYFMSGNFQEAAEHLTLYVDREGDQSYRALYLLGRISLLMGDFRQSKEFFERAYEDMPQGVQWRAQAGIGDALYGSGQYEEAIRRYRVAKNDAAGSSSVAAVELKIALCEMALGREAKARVRMKEAMDQIPVLSAWSGKEEAFYQSLSMQGLNQSPQIAKRIFVTVGPVSKVIRKLEDIGIAEDVSSKRQKIGDAAFLLCGPFNDPVEAMIFAETVKSQTSLQTKVQIQ
ncbi:tetratricopeptide repeat protein [bacterium]|nr:MAG: tetratricopeptide repeat protein [bacterium]